MALTHTVPPDECHLMIPNLADAVVLIIKSPLSVKNDIYSKLVDKLTQQQLFFTRRTSLKWKATVSLILHKSVRFTKNYIPVKIC